MTHTNAAIAFHQVDCHIKDKLILKNITGICKSGKITILLGPSGSGKTTLLKLCNGLISPSKGEIIIDGKAIDVYNPPALRKKVGIALQQSPMIQGTVYDNLALPHYLQGKVLPKQKANDMLENVGLNSDFLQQNSADLSGGQKQRVAIARTLLNEPDILLLDEITASLDQEAARQLESYLQYINTNLGVTMIWITHQIDQAKRIGDDMWLMDNGELIETGPISLLTNSSNEHVTQFMQRTES